MIQELINGLIKDLNELNNVLAICKENKIDPTDIKKEIKKKNHEIWLLERIK